MSKLFIVVFSLYLISACVGLTIQDGNCPTATPMTGFNPTDYAGTWYVIESLDTTAGTCNIHSWTNTGPLAANIRDTRVENNILQSVTGSAIAATAGSTYTVSIPGGDSYPYLILTASSSYALVYSCENFQENSVNRRRVRAWKLGRNPGQLPTDAQTAINNIINNNVALSEATFSIKRHTEADCNTVVELPGACPTLSGHVTNLDVTRFIGTWREISRTRNEEQTGQCGRTVYGTGTTPNSISIENREVTSEALGITTGEATIGANGLLTATFNINGVNRVANLYVLATDYENYALVYRCVDLPNSRRRISSWQLQKSEGSLNSLHINEINSAIAAIDGLERVYYQPTAQDDNACFYYPEVGENPDFIELPGFCPTTITGAANFNLATFIGTWYEVARYPQPTQTGQCDRAVYALDPTATGVVSVMNSEVNNELLREQSGTARATDVHGVLEVEFIINEVTLRRNLHVLATDNENFALLYSCENRVVDGVNRRRVGSWKLSKDVYGALLPEHHNVMNAAISATQGLRNDIYRETSQTDTACFYYPNYSNQLPQFIDLRGHCPTTITGAANFDLNTFIGTWYETARLPQPTQTGQCDRAVYAPGATAGVISVVNSEVNNELLREQSGTATATDVHGVLQVQFDINGVTQTRNLHVLATDNINYALLYSCENRVVDGENRRRVGSWKLSKDVYGALLPEHHNAINEAISTTPGLRNDYYRETSQTDIACFYYPDYSNQLPQFIELRGECPTITGIPNFNLNAFIGTWYEVARYPQPTQTGQCDRAVYALDPTATGVVSVMNSEVNNELLREQSGTARATDVHGVLEVEFIINEVTLRRNLHVLATDNENFALLYSCENRVVDGENRRRVGSWKLSKDVYGALLPEHHNVMNAAISATQGLRNDIYRETSQTDTACFYYPNYSNQLPQFIDLRGHCPTTITGAANFDLNTFIGTWYETARLPQPTQTGQCDRAVYAPGTTAGVISVVNSEVNNELLREQSGTATATDVHGVLQVQFDINGVTQRRNLHVLVTDNINYALLYSCEDIVEENGERRRRVGSWKLSKDVYGALLPEHHNAINEAISTTPGLRDDYYRETSQTDIACFYYPDYSNELPQFIELRGECPSITGIPNFNLNAFLGRWYEVARLPQPTQTGQCNRAEYATGATTGFLSVENTAVENEALTTLRGQARAVGTSGELEVTLNIGDEETVSRLFVLAVVSERYALLYGCENIPAEGGNPRRRRVTSWKLSKNRQGLNTADNAAINAVISATQGLRNDYYLDIHQTDEACFYYPNYNNQLPEYIELRGSCPTTITGVNNFNLNAFHGEWQEFARFPQPAQTGQCNRAVYASAAGGGTSIESTQVIDEDLERITGVVRTTNQPGVLEVVINESTPTNIHVLAVDYERYALLYSCVNREVNGENKRRVGSWILLKDTVQLDDAEMTAINTAISATQGLHESYYRRTYQNDTSCFHYPTQSGAHVIIPGRCDTQFSGLPDINLAAFTNESVWYQIARYDEAEGTSCIGTRLRLNGDEIIVNHVERVGEEDRRLRGIARLSPAPAVGRLSFKMDGSDDEEEIYIVATDYNSYAIAYNCENVGTNERLIRAWQLSRTRTVSAPGALALAQLVTERQEFTLRSTYFKLITHLAGEELCPEPSSAFLFKSSIIVIFVCAVLQLVW